MGIQNSLDVKSLELGQDLFLIRYSNAAHPDFVMVKFRGLTISNQLRYINPKGVIKKMSKNKAHYRMFNDINEMARSLYDCFVKREKEIIDEYKPLFINSQDIRPELWV